jgi:hypothetical protein
MWLLLLFGSCAAPEPVTVPLAATVVDCPQVASVNDVAPVPDKPTPATKATAAYHGLQQREANAVTAPAATAPYIRTIHQADEMARKALKELISQDGHPTESAIKAARDSIDHLVQTLETTEGGGSM